MELNDSSEAYSHHQYRPISVEFFDRSLSSPDSDLKTNNIIECKSDYAIKESKDKINKADKLQNIDGSQVRTN